MSVFLDSAAEAVPSICAESWSGDGYSGPVDVLGRRRGGRLRFVVGAADLVFQPQGDWLVLSAGHVWWKVEPQSPMISVNYPLPVHS